jgi:hypothetical protein
MDPTPAFGFDACCTGLVGATARALAERHGETPEQQFVRAGSAVHTIMGFLPRDVTEAMLASHCVMLHELMVDSVHNALCAEEANLRRAELHTLLAMNKAFCANLVHLRHYQKRPAEGTHEAPNDVQAEPAGSDSPAQCPEHTGTERTADQMGAQPSAVAPARVAPAPDGLSAIAPRVAEAVGIRRATPAAAAALKAGDPLGFARAMGIEQPSEAFLAAANAAGSPFDPGYSGPWPVSERVATPKT